MQEIADSAPETATFEQQMRNGQAMWLKVIIVILFIGNIIALSSAFYTLVSDQGRGSKRTANRLLIRVLLAALLLIAIVYGVWTGDLGIAAPWYSPGP